ncbi:hypothetical protein PMI21_05687 [Pseudomonas sp. GM18]|nr:hypothetical protein PMI21_05687 [Pseudomonas sp. GM18]
MTAGNLNFIVRGRWLDGSRLQFSFGHCASEVASIAPSIRSGLFSGGHFCFAEPLSLLLEPLLYCNLVLFGVG